MRASEWEFRHRFWLICLAYFVGFMCYRFDNLNAAEALARWMFSRRDPHLWTFAINGFIFVWKLNSRLYYIILGVSLAAYFLLRMVLKRLHQQNGGAPATEGPYPAFL